MGMLARDVVLWAVDDVIVDMEERRLPGRVTDVFYRQKRPKPGSLLLGVGGTSSDRGGEEPALVLVGVARRSQQIATGKDRTLVTPVQPLDEPVPVAQLIAALPEAVRRRLDLQHRLPALLTPSRLPPQGGQAVLAALQRLSPTTAEWLASLREAESPVADEHAARLREERDAVSLAIDLAGIAAPDDLLYTPGDGLDSSTAFGATFNPLYVMDNEDDLLAEDLRRFDPHNQLQMRSASVARFTSDRFALTVMNVNRKPLEQALGVDLVYYDEVAQIFTLVQYKRLVRRPASGDGAGQRWAYTSQDELVKHLQRMDIGPNEPVNSKDWRMAPSPFWFKFVRDGDFAPGDPFVLKGMYVPADYLRLALADGSLRTGPRTGFEVTYSNTRYLPREVFVELVRRGFAGTTRAGTHAVAQVVVERAKTHEVVLALKTPIGQDEPTNHSYRTTDEPPLSPSPEPWGSASDELPF
ncbi:hypothetical protein DLJ60_22755 [Micromonospora chalcea]|uniref:Uncharacterized protein n=2 Tax=Micromonosporaceae TaxID=28056 RepID=A0ABX9XYR0_MICCH|nr:hypothetical protein A8711_08730 [Micromonospora sp. II]RQW89434.1 hypothetical protein DLJ60_22755 [Micromonospora chalcea]RQX58247.1 hypothetical protein DLJ57_04280 [Micromonospora chalcea]